MLQSAHAYTKLPASDPQRARAFYVETLGFTPEWEREGHIWLNHADGSSILVFPSAGKASGDHDQCGWIVDDIEAEVADLRSRGVTFEEFPGLRFLDGVTVDGVFKAAWFRDSEGNLLSLRSRAPRAQS
jgi:catechol 2,3-dioxygenase-like lactoylglutathione lyase family enzyme